MEQHFQDLCALLFPRGEILNPSSGIYFKLVTRCQFSNPFFYFTKRKREAGCLQSNHHILGDGKCGYEHEFLMNHGDAVPETISRRPKIDRLTFHTDLTRCLTVVTR